VIKLFEEATTDDLKSLKEKTFIRTEEVGLTVKGKTRQKGAKSKGQEALRRRVGL